MKVEQILQSKGVEVFAVSESASINEAVGILGEKNIGAVIVEKTDGGVAGILSERDVVRRLRTDGPDILNKPVSACMTPNPFTCAPEATVDELLAEMTNKRIRHMPVVRDGALMGVVSIGDVVKRKIDEAEKEAAELKQYIAT